MPNVTNKHLLLGLIGLGVLNALLCIVVVLRENANGARLAQLTGEQQAEFQKVHAEGRGTRDELARTAAKLSAVAGVLSQTRADLASAQKSLARVQTTLEADEADPPWRRQVESLSKQVTTLEKRLKDLQALLPKEKPVEKDKSVDPPRE